jgi:L-iditol 2-dehydrogenase
MQTKALGAFAEYLLIPGHVVAQNLFRKPEGVGFDEAAFLEPLACVVHAMEPLGITRKDTVLIMGAGPIGLLHLLLSRSFGARVLMTGFEEERLKTAKALGAYAVFHPSLTAESVDAITEGVGADYVFECTGQPQVWEESPAYVRRGGTVVLFGGCQKGTTVTYDTERLHYDEITLKGTFHFTPRDVRKAYLLLKSGKIGVSSLVSGSFSLDEVGDAFIGLSRGEGIKFAIRP